MSTPNMFDTTVQMNKTSPIKHDNKRNVLSCLLECLLMAFEFYETRPNSIFHRPLPPIQSYTQRFSFQFPCVWIFSFRLKYLSEILMLFLGESCESLFGKFDGTKPELYRRYIDDCFGATSCSRQELDYFITSVNSFHPALKYTWVVSECSIAFLDINVSISGNRLSTSVHYKPTDSHSYLLHSSSHPAHVKNPSPTRNSLDCDVFVATTLTSLRNQRKCVSSSKHAVIPIQLSTTANTVHSQSIRNRHHFRHTTN